MRMHPIISILFAAWFGLGHMLGPRFLCTCPDGTVTVQIGQRFCCDSDDSYCDSCDGSATADGERCDAPGATWSCSDGCESVLISDEVVGSIKRAAEIDVGSSSTLTVHPYQTMPAAPRWTSSMRVSSMARIPNCRAAGISQLRSVILLV